MEDKNKILIDQELIDQLKEELRQELREEKLEIENIKQGVKINLHSNSESMMDLINKANTIQVNFFNDSKQDRRNYIN